MTIANRGEGLSFGLSAIRIRNGSVVVGMAEITGSFTCDIAPEINTTMGGASAYPVSARLGRATGEGSLVLRERPLWTDGELQDAESVVITPSGTATATGVVDISGTTASTFTITLGSEYRGYHDVMMRATTGSKWTAYVAGTSGAQEFSSLSLATRAVSLGSTGIQVAKSTGTSSVGDTVMFSVSPRHGGQTTISVPQVRKGNEYELTCYSNVGGPGDAIARYIFPRVLFKGASVSLTDNETQGDVEMPFQLISPADGSSIYQRQIVKPV